jgi:hypothetical protein
MKFADDQKYPEKAEKEQEKKEEEEFGEKENRCRKETEGWC